MGGKTKTLSQWCTENNREDLLAEIDFDKNNKFYNYDYLARRIEYNSPNSISWRCSKGHEWRCEVVGRTLFGLKCPECYPESSFLPVGTKYGCLTIIGDYDDNIERSLLNDNNRHSIKHTLNRPRYICRCKCGKIHQLSQFDFLLSRRRYCTEMIKEKEIHWEISAKMQFDKNITEDDILNDYCGLAVEAYKKKKKTYYENARRNYAENYNTDFTGTFFESLEVLECIDEHYEERRGYSDLRKKNAYFYTIYKLYKCRCYICHREHTVKCSQFCISPPTAYGETAYHGYWSKVQCDCHMISSFQWIVNKILIDNNIPYRVEYSFSDLYGVLKINRLKYDFAILNDDNTVKCLIECQGEQHYMPVEEFGGDDQYKYQIKNDKLKKEYAEKHDIKLIEISYKEKKYEQIEAILRENGIIN